MRAEPAEQIDRWIGELRSTLGLAAELAARGRESYDSDPALRLAFEALSARVGDLAKRLVELNPTRFDSPLWSAAARNRDIVVHHYHRIDHDLLWNTVTRDFATLRDLLDR